MKSVLSEIHKGAFVRDLKSFTQKREKIIKDGLGNLQIVSDFDSTMSHPKKLSSWSLIERSHSFSKEYHELVTELYNKYYPVEMDL